MHPVQLKETQTLWVIPSCPTSFMLSESIPEWALLDPEPLQHGAASFTSATVDDFVKCCEANSIGVVAAWLHLKVNLEYFVDILEV